MDIRAEFEAERRAFAQQVAGAINREKERIMTTNFDAIEFDPTRHIYTYRGQRLRSVTQTLKPVKPPFDAPEVAAHVAERQGRDVADILAEWDKKRQAGLERGRATHTYIERTLRGQPIEQNGRLGEMDAFDTFWGKLQGMIAPDIYKLEWIVGDAGLGIAGTLDALLIDTKQETLHVFDWKTGSKFRLMNPWERLHPPFDDLENCELHTYSLQVSLYRLIVERNTRLTLGNGYIVHLRGDGRYEVHGAMDLRDRLAAWLLAERRAGEQGSGGQG